jgi:hypothetical protein
MDYRSKQHQAWKQSIQSSRDAHISPQVPSIDVKRSRFGFAPTMGDITTTQVTLRRASNQKTTRKPSMPKMPWDNQS